MKKIISFYTLPYKLIENNEYDFNFGFCKSAAIVLFFFVLQSVICFWVYTFFPATSNAFNAALLIIFEIFLCLPIMCTSLIYIFGDRVPIIKIKNFSFKMAFIFILMIISLRMVYPLFVSTIEYIIKDFLELNSISILKDLLFSNELYNTYEFYYFLSAIFYAPFLEEILFRGIILRGLSKKYSIGVAIFLSSFLFALAHLSPLQSLHAFILGSISGCIYYKTDCIYYCIILHLVSNAIATVSSILFTPSLIAMILSFLIGLPIFVFTIIKLIMYNRS